MPVLDPSPPRALAALIGALALLGAARAATEPEAAVATPTDRAAGPQAKLAPLKALKTYVDSGTAAGAALPAFTYLAVGTPLEYLCSAAAGCPVVATLELQIKQVGVNAPALCLFVDDAAASCPTNDQLSATTGFKVMSHHAYTVLPLSDVPHKLEMRAYSQLTTQIYRYQAEYQVFVAK